MSCACNSNLGRAVALLGPGANRFLRGYLGDELSDVSGDSGSTDMMFTGDTGGGGGSGSSSDGFSNLDFGSIDQGTYVPPADAQFSPVSNAPQDPNIFSNTSTGPGGVQGYQMPDGTFIDTYGNTYNPDGSQISPLGTVTDAQGNVIFADGTQVLANGTYVDQFGNQYPPSTPQAQQAQQRAAASSGGNSGGSSGGSKGSGSQNPLQQAICMLAPNSPQCRQAQLQQTTRQQQSSSSFSTWFQKNWGYLALGAAGLIIVPPLLQNALSGGRR